MGIEVELKNMLKRIDRGEPDAFVAVITPVVAGALLARNLGEGVDTGPRNRSLSLTKFREYVGVMERDGWVYTGESLCFDRGGNLVDGQHRLKAVEKTGVTLLATVSVGVSELAFSCIDKGKSRSLGDTFSSFRVKNSHAVAATSEVLKYILTRRRRTNVGQVLSHLEKYRECEELYPGLAEFVLANNRLYGDRKRMDLAERKYTPTPPPVIALYYLFSQVDKPKAVEFIEQVWTGDGVPASEQNHPAKVIRKMMRRKEYCACTQDERRFLFIHNMITGWNKFVKGEPMMKVSYQDHNVIPKIVGLDYSAFVGAGPDALAS